MIYKLEVMWRATSPFDSRLLLREAEFDSVTAIRDAVFSALFTDSVDHVFITHNGERRIVTSCAQFCADYMQDAPQDAG